MNFFLKIAAFLLYTGLVLATDPPREEDSNRISTGAMITQLKTKYPECYRHFWGGTDESDPRVKYALKIVAEALFYAEGSDFAKLVDRMSFEEINKLEPLKTSFQFDGPTDIGKALKQLFDKLKEPEMSHHASWAVNRATTILYINRVGFETFKRELGIK